MDKLVNKFCKQEQQHEKLRRFWKMGVRGLIINQ